MRLEGEKVRIVRIKSHEEEPLDIISGTVTDQWPIGLNPKNENSEDDKNK